MFPISESINKYFRYFGLVTVVIIGVVSVVGSGGSGGGGEDPLPTITSVSPAQSSDSALVTALVEAQFRIDMDPTSFNDNSFLFAVNSSNITASTISYNTASKIATFVPPADLISGQEYFATITTAVKDSAGNNPLSTNYVWSFRIAPTLVPVSLDSNGLFGISDSSSPIISADGNYVAFVSTSNNLCGGSLTNSQICRKNLITGEVELVSATAATPTTPPEAGTSASSAPSISADGNYVAFVSTSNNLCGGANPKTQICRKDMTTGELELVSATAEILTPPTPPAPGTDPSSAPSISADGNYVAFVSTSNNLCGGADPNTQICRKDMTTGTAGPLELVSATAEILTPPTPPAPGTDPSSAPSISADGNYVAFVSTSNNLCGGADPNTQICRKDMTTGTAGPLELVSATAEILTPPTPPAPGTSASSAPSISADGNYVAFVSTSNNLCGGADPNTQICRKDMTTGTAGPFELVSATAEILTPPTPSEPGDSASSAPSISADGNYVAFVSTSSNLCGGADPITQICLKDISGGIVQLISDANPDSPVVQADGPSTSPKISNNGRYISFTSNAPNLGSGGSIDQVYRGAR